MENAKITPEQQESNELIAIKNRYNLQELPIKIKIAKKATDKKDIEKAEKLTDENSYVCFIRQADIPDLDQLYELYANKKFTATQMALDILWLEGDTLIKTEKNLIASCVGIIGSLIDYHDSEFTKN